MPTPESAAIARRVHEVREELFGQHGGPLLAEKLGMPWRRWYAYESGQRTIPAATILRFIKLTGACAGWLLSGIGPKYGPCFEGRDRGRFRVPHPDPAAMADRVRVGPGDSGGR